MKRIIEGYAAAWTIDFGGDMITRGAFANTLKSWKSGGRIIPLLNQHRYDGIEQVLGHMIDAKEDSVGLFAKFEVADDVDGDRAYSKTNDGHVDGLSIGYVPVRSRDADAQLRLRGATRILEEIELREVSVVIWPMNQDARITNVSGPSAPRKMSDADVRELKASLKSFLSAHLATDAECAELRSGLTAFRNRSVLETFPKSLKAYDAREARREAAYQESCEDLPRLQASIKRLVRQSRNRERDHIARRMTKWNNCNPTTRR